MKRTTTPQATVTLNPRQYEALTSTAQQTFFISGIGGGKSFGLGVWLFIQSSQAVGAVGLCVAPTFDVVANSTLPRLVDAWAKMGYTEGKDYVIGKRPPKSWGIRPYSVLGSYKILTWRWGSYILFDGAENYNKHRGIEADFIGIDEFRDVKPGAYDVYVGRLRGKAFETAGIKQKLFVASTMPEDFAALEKYVNKKAIRFVYGTSHDNKRNLPVRYIEGLEELYDELTYDREVLSRRRDLSNLAAYHQYDDEANVIWQLEFDPNALTWIAWDFNASAQKPMATLILQRREVEGREVDVVMKEFIAYGQRTEYQARDVAAYLREKRFVGELRITGDSSGHNAQSAATRTDYITIVDELGEFLGHYSTPFASVRTRRTRAIADRVASLNTRLRNRKGDRRLFVHGLCKVLRNDLKRVRWHQDKTKGLDQETDPKLTHASDALTYFTYVEYPPELTRQELTDSIRERSQA